MGRLFSVVLSLLLTALATDSAARRSHLTPEQKSQLQNIHRIYVNVLALTEEGRIPSSDIMTVVGKRFQSVGFEIVTDRQLPHDVEFRVKCEVRKRWEGTTSKGGDFELFDAPLRLWNGPACQFTYRLEGQDLDWHTEVRTPFEDYEKAAQRAKTSDAKVYAFRQLALQLQTFDFPILVIAEWGQQNRLVSLLTSSHTTQERKLKILEVLKHVPAKEAVPHLLKMIREDDFPTQAIGALSGVGSATIPLLIDLFQNQDHEAHIRAAAAKGLGNTGAKTGDAAAIPPLLNYLAKTLQHMEASSDIDFPVLTEVIWAIGQVASEKAIEPIEQLNSKIWIIYDPSPEMKKLREVASVVLKYVDLTSRIL